MASCPVCGTWTKGGALPSDSLCDGHYQRWYTSPECNAFHANLHAAPQAFQAWLTRMKGPP